MFNTSQAKRQRKGNNVHCIQGENSHELKERLMLTSKMNWDHPKTSPKISATLLRRWKCFNPKEKFTGSTASCVAALMLVVSAKAVHPQESSRTEFLLQDPLSCATMIDLPICEGPAGLWQLGRLSLAVTATSEALRLAGMNEESDLIQATIYLDGLRYGFHTALDVPTLQLMDLAALGEQGPFKDNHEKILELSVFSRELLFPGTAKELGLSGVIDGLKSNTDGFDSFDTMFVQMQSNPGAFQNASIFSFSSALPVDFGTADPILTMLKIPVAEEGNSFTPTSRDLLFKSEGWYQNVLIPTDITIKTSAAFAFTEMLQVGHYSDQAGVQSQLFAEKPCVTCDLGGESPFLGIVLAKGEETNLAPLAQETASGYDLLGNFSQRGDPNYTTQVNERQQCKDKCTDANMPEATFMVASGVILARAISYQQEEGLLSQIAGEMLASKATDMIEQHIAAKQQGMAQCVKECPVVEVKAEELSPTAPKETDEQEPKETPADPDADDKPKDDTTEPPTEDPKPAETSTSAAASVSMVDQETYLEQCVGEDAKTKAMCPCNADPKGQVSCPSPSAMVSELSANMYMAIRVDDGIELVRINGGDLPVQSVMEGLAFVSEAKGGVSNLTAITGGFVDLTGFVSDESTELPVSELMGIQSDDFLTRFGVERQ